MIATQSPDRTSAHVLGDAVALEARHARSCPRAVVWAGRDIPPSDDVPADQRNGEAMRRALRQPTLDAMIREEWTLSSSNREPAVHAPEAHTSWEALPGVRLYGVPDATGSGELTGGREAVVLVSSGPGLIDLYAERCAGAVHAHHGGFGGRTPPMVVASLDPETGRLGARLLEPPHVEWLNGLTQRVLRPLAEAAVTGDLPQATPLDPANECRNCPWRTRCRGTPDGGTPGNR